MIYVFVKQTGNVDGENIYTSFLIDATNEKTAWLSLIKIGDITPDDIRVDDNLELSIDGVYMVELSEEEFKKSIETSRYNGHKVNYDHAASAAMNL